MEEKFSLPLLQAISDWQRDGNAKQNKKRGQILKEVCVSLPEKYRTCSLCCFRQIALPKGGVWSLIGENCLPEKISSWTPDLGVAMTFKGGVPPKDQGYQGVIFCLLPPPGSVIVNLCELYQDSDFIAALKKNQQHIANYHNGVGRHGNDQCEVVLEIASMAQDDIYSLGGHSSSFDDLIDRVAKEIYGHAATAVEREALMHQVEHVRSRAGPRWLKPEVTHRVLKKIKPRVEWLATVKHLKNAAE